MASGKDPRMKLEALVAQALKNSPDIRVAEWKLRETEAELNRVRLQVTQKVAALRMDILEAKAILEEAITKLQTYYSSNRDLTTTEGFTKVRLRREKAAYDVARLEAELRYQLGTGAGNTCVG